MPQTHLHPVLRATLARNAQGVFELMPGDVAMGRSGDQFKTLLGSCVSVILTNPQRTVACMCHIVHVGLPNAASAGNTAYGTYAMLDMIARLGSAGVSHRHCLAYVYGGGNMFPKLFSEQHVGANNIDWVLAYLHEHHIEVVDSCLGGNGYRKVSWTVGPQDPVVEAVFSEHGDIHGN